MMKRLALYAVAVSGLGLLLVGTEAWAEEKAHPKLTCPATGTARRNTSVPITVAFRNDDTTKSLSITQAALALHLGNVTLIGPLVFHIPTTTLNAATFAPPPPGCSPCLGSIIPAEATLAVSVPIPAQARPGTFVSIGLGFFGNLVGSSIRKELGSDGCTLEIVP